MIKLSKKVEYAMIAILHLANRQSDEPVSSREIADSYNIPPELLGKVLQRLVKSNFIKSVQGTNGGYQLVRPLDSLSLYTLIDEIEGPLHITQCTSHDVITCNCRQLDECTIKHAVGEIQLEINHFFQNITLDKFLN